MLRPILQNKLTLISRESGEKHSAVETQASKTGIFSCMRNLRQVQNGVFNRLRGQLKCHSTSEFLACFLAKTRKEMACEDKYAVCLILKRAD